MAATTHRIAAPFSHIATRGSAQIDHHLPSGFEIGLIAAAKSFTSRPTEKIDLVSWTLGPADAVED